MSDLSPEETRQELELLVIEANAAIRDLRTQVADAEKARKRLARAHGEFINAEIRRVLTEMLNDLGPKMKEQTQESLDKAVDKVMREFKKIERSIFVGWSSRTPGGPKVKYDLREEADRRLRETGFAPPEKP